MASSAPRVLLLGFGAIGRQLVTLFDISEFEVSAFVRDAAPHHERGTLGVSLYDDNLAELIDAHDIVVECAGVPAAKEHGTAVIASGKGLVLTSVGALADPDARRALLAGPGKVHVTSGAIGGFDLWSALAESNAADTVKIRTTKNAEALIQDWMNDDERAELENATEPFFFLAAVRPMQLRSFRATLMFPLRLRGQPAVEELAMMSCLSVRLSA